MSVGERIRELRIAKHMTQQQLADKCHVSKQSVCIWESDKQGVKNDNLVLLCDIFNVSMDYLTGRENRCPRILTSEEMNLVDAYRALSEDQKDMICKMLEIKRDAESTDSLMEA